MTRVADFGYSAPMKHMMGLLCGVFVTTVAVADGNRAGAPRRYKADISPVVAFQELQQNKRIVLIDVRRAGEFAAAHVDGAFNIPYPWVRGIRAEDPEFIGMSDADFLAHVTARVPDRTTPIMTICSMGMRSARGEHSGGCRIYRRSQRVDRRLGTVPGRYGESAAGRQRQRHRRNPSPGGGL